MTGIGILATASSMGLALFGASAFLSMPADAASPAPIAPISDAMKPGRTFGIGLAVVDLERSMAFYRDVLGYKVAGTIPPQGEAKEYLMSLSGKIDSEMVIVLTKAEKSTAVAEGKTRIVLLVRDGEGLALRARDAGFTVTKHGRLNFIVDPDGYLLELFVPQTPPPSPPR